MWSGREGGPRLGCPLEGVLVCSSDTVHLLTLQISHRHHGTRGMWGMDLVIPDRLLLQGWILSP